MTTTGKLSEANHDDTFHALYVWALDTRQGGIMAGASAAALRDELQEIKHRVASQVKNSEQANSILDEIAEAESYLQAIQKGMDDGKTSAEADFYKAQVTALERIYKDIVATVN